MVGQAQVVVDGLGHTDEPHAAAHTVAVAGKLCDGVHGVVAADIEHRADVVLVKQGEQLDERGRVHIRVRQLVAAAAQIAGGGALEQLDAHAVVQQDVQFQRLLLEQTFDAVLHAVHLVCTQTAGRLVNACQTGVDHGGRAAALTNDHIPGHENLLFKVPLLIILPCNVPLPRRLCGGGRKALHCPQTGRQTRRDLQVIQKQQRCALAFCKMRKICCDSIVPVLAVVCKTQLVAQAK